MNLNNLWEWNPITGDPFTPPDESPNARHCPSLEEMNELVHARNVVANDLKTRLLDFMTSNDTRRTTRFDAQNNGALTGYLRFIRALDFKKIQLEYVAGRLRMEKLPRDTPFHGEPDGIVNQIRVSKNRRIYGESYFE